MIHYLTGVSTAASEACALAAGIGLMIQPRNSYHPRIHRYPLWAADNGAFTRRAEGFSADAFRAMLQRPLLRYYTPRCLFVAAPDRLEVLPTGQVIGDAAGTLEQFPAWAREIRDAGFRVALVAQNGLEALLDRVPWDALDVLFLGGGREAQFITGDNRFGEWKLSEGARCCVVEARRRGKRTHMGRVNSGPRLASAAAIFCDTADGNFLRFHPGNIDRMLAWFDGLAPGVQAHLPWGAH